MKRIVTLLVIVLCVGLSACTDAPKATNLLESQGYTRVETTGYSLFGCNDND